MRADKSSFRSSLLQAAARPVSTGLSFLARITFLRNTTLYQKHKNPPTTTTTMAGNSNSTTEIPFRAADGVSRFFLFEALRTGCEEIGSASAQLESARDKAEKMLVKDSTVEFDSLLQEVCFDLYVSR